MADVYTRLSSIPASDVKLMLNADRVFSQLTDDQKTSFINAAQNLVAAFRNKKQKEDYLVTITPAVIVYADGALHYGTTAQRPTGLGVADTSYPYYDTTLHTMIWWNGTDWQ